MKHAFALTACALALSTAAAQDEAMSRADALRFAPDGPCWVPDPEDEMPDEIIVTATRMRSPSSSKVQAEPEAALDMAAPAPTSRPTLGSAPPPLSRAPATALVRDASRFDAGDPNPVKRTTEAPVSTLSADVDTSSYAITRRALCEGRLPTSDSVRAEEFVNAFDYDYGRPPSASEPFAVDVAVFETPWNPETELLRVGIEGFDLDPAERPRANVVLLLDVSGSMSSYDKLPLVKTAMTKLVQQLGPDDRVAIVAYAGASGVVLEPTPGSERRPSCRPWTGCARAARRRAGRGWRWPTGWPRRTSTPKPSTA